MERLLAFLAREAKVYNNARAAILLANWQRDGRLTDAELYEVGRIKVAAAAREAVTAAKVRAKLARRATIKAAEAKAAGQSEKLANATAARLRLRRKLGFPD